MDRSDIVNAFAAYAMIHDDETMLYRTGRSQDLRRLRDVSTVKDQRPYEILSCLEPGALMGYFGLVDKFKGREAANEAFWEYARVGWPWGVTVQVLNRDDNPFDVEFIVSDPIAEDWADAHGSLDGGTWEGTGDPGFVYDTGYWHDKLFEKLQAEGYDLDFSQWSDPEPEDHATAAHIAECEDCQNTGDFDQAREHMNEEHPLTVAANEALADLAADVIRREREEDERQLWLAFEGP